MSFYTDPSDKQATIAPSDTTDLTGCRGIYVGGTGDVLVRSVNSPDTTVTFASVPVGTIIPVRAVRVMAATTATNLVAMF